MKNYREVFTIVATLSLGIPAHATNLDATYESIATITKDCESNFENSGHGADWHYAQCQKTVQYVWNEALDKVYADLLLLLPKPCNVLLQNAQSAWLAYLNADIAAFDSSIGVRPGRNMLASATRRAQIIEERVMMLESLYTEFSSDPDVLCPND